MIPEVRFTHRNKSSYFPAENSIHLSLAYSWRNTISMFIHELVHWFQWEFIYQKDTGKWNDEEDKQEKQADRVEDFIYYTLLRGKPDDYC